MDYCFENGKLLIFKDNLLHDKLFLFALKSGILNLFSFEVDKPRILICDPLGIINQVQKALANFAQVENIDIKSCTYIDILEKVKTEHNFSPFDALKNFSVLVHFLEFDAGIMLGKNHANKIEFCFVSGSGFLLSQAKQSVIEKTLKKYEMLKNLKKTAKKCKKTDKNIKKYAKNYKNKIFYSWNLAFQKQRYEKLLTRFNQKSALEKQIFMRQNLEQTSKLLEYI